MYKFKLVYGFAMCREDKEVVGKHIIEAKSMRSAMCKANKLMDALGDRAAPPNTTERCLASMQRWERGHNALCALKFSMHWANFTARLYAPNAEALAPARKTAPARRAGEDMGAYHARVSTNSVRVRRGSASTARRRSRKTAGFTTADVARIRKAVGA